MLSAGMVLWLCAHAGGAWVRLQVFRPGIDQMAEDEELDYDPTAYDCLHRLQLDWPCLRCADGTAPGALCI